MIERRKDNVYNGKDNIGNKGECDNNDTEEEAMTMWQQQQ